MWVCRVSECVCVLSITRDYRDLDSSYTTRPFNERKRCIVGRSEYEIIFKSHLTLIRHMIRKFLLNFCKKFSDIYNNFEWVLFVRRFITLFLRQTYKTQKQKKKTHLMVVVRRRRQNIFVKLIIGPIDINAKHSTFVQKKVDFTHPILIWPRCSHWRNSLEAQRWRMPL